MWKGGLLDEKKKEKENKSTGLGLVFYCLSICGMFLLKTKPQSEYITAHVCMEELEKP